MQYYDKCSYSQISVFNRLNLNNSHHSDTIRPVFPLKNYSFTSIVIRKQLYWPISAHFPCLIRIAMRVSILCNHLHVAFLGISSLFSIWKVRGLKAFGVRARKMRMQPGFDFPSLKNVKAGTWLTLITSPIIISDECLLLQSPLINIHTYKEKKHNMLYDNALRLGCFVK